MSCILKCNNEDELVVDGEKAKVQDYVEKPSVIYKPSTAVPPNNLIEIAAPKDLAQTPTFFPTVDTFYDKDAKQIVLLMELPGFLAADIDLEVGDGEICVSGPRPKEELFEKYGQNLDIHIRERKVGYFYRRFKLPHNALDNTVKASYQNGILEVRLTCIEFSPKTRVEIAA